MPDWTRYARRSASGQYLSLAPWPRRAETLSPSAPTARSDREMWRHFPSLTLAIVARLASDSASDYSRRARQGRWGEKPSVTGSVHDPTSANSAFSARKFCSGFRTHHARHARDAKVSNLASNRLLLSSDLRGLSVPGERFRLRAEFSRHERQARHVARNEEVI